MTSPWSDRAGAEAALIAIGRSGGSRIDIADAALALAIAAGTADDLSSARAHLAELVTEAATHGPPSPERAAETLAAVLVGRHDYRGDQATYDDLQNADLLRVIARRRGLPVALSIIWLHVARALDLAAFGLNVPGHFVIRIGEGEDARIVDPFNDGAILDPPALAERIGRIIGPGATLGPEHLAAVSDRAVLLRLQNNIKLRHIKSGRHAEAVSVIERMLWLAPGSDALWSELGALHYELDNLMAARGAFEQALALAEDAATRQRIAAALETLRTSLN